MLKIVPFWFIGYKFFNSLFLGVSVGAVFTIYSSLNPSIYSIGGIFLAFSMLIIARFYKYILNTKWFFIISLLVEIVLLLSIFYFIYSPYNYASALFIYIGYQITFVFGSYLVRAETLLLKTNSLLTKVDTAKQLGYLLGMGFSYLTYMLFDCYKITNPQTQVYMIHYGLIVIEIVVIILVIKSFSKKE